MFKSGQSFLSFLLEKSCTINELLRHKLHGHIPGVPKKYTDFVDPSSKHIA